MGRFFVYHERQLGNLCGVHCVNNLLQGPRFGPGDLAEIGARLDKKEARLLRGAGVPGCRSENYDDKADGGNFSVQVLRVALARAGLKLLPAEHPDGKEKMNNPARASAAFVVQRHNHWFALREAGSSWWDLDSLLDRPKPLDESQLAARLEGSSGSSSNVFLVMGGRLPEAKIDGGSCNWHDAEKLLAEMNPEASTALFSVRSLMSGSEEDTWSDAGEAEPPLRLEDFTDTERRAGLALVGGDPSLAVDVLSRARKAIARLPKDRPRHLAKAISSAVETCLQARLGLQDSVAKLVALLCVPSQGALAAAAARLDSGDLAHRLLTALTRKAHGWLWTKGLAEAASIAVELLLALPPKDESSAARTASVEPVPVTAPAAAAKPPSDVGARKLTKSASAEAVERRRSNRDATFEALDQLLGSTEPEAGLLGRPKVSEPGLKSKADQGAKPDTAKGRDGSKVRKRQRNLPTTGRKPGRKNSFGSLVSNKTV